MKKVHFIINPIAGKGGTGLDTLTLSKYFKPEDYEIEIKTSDYPGHASILTMESVANGADIVVACGGDGTINEVASCLVHTPVTLGIIPLGSGNGFAESLHISRNVQRAIEVIKDGKEGHVDVAMVNGKPFFSNMGIGFDAKVISNYNASKERRLWAYLKAILKSIKDFKYNESLQVEMNGKKFQTNPFMFFISNSKVMGYDISLTRTASLEDGLLDVVIIENLSRGEMLVLGLLVLLRLSQYLKKVKYYKVKELKVAFTSVHNDRLIQADGELHNLGGQDVVVNIQEQGLCVLMPQG
ncbi:diacylglycerol kinase family protein [Allomuricauda sp. NBRC 101325]|uniref:diacylglycerol/lipid kinase family protein n=1 Tax=Allomuricauda sp. NBRC 101325 TaxID=1113758 RepID=UPI0024A2F4B6|nr:YegS/Rv2252/BmrU family lipid kinase [Muricauda sp. NBRC 101325]GLU42892.1 hypothetical protein Musp01_05160 [Muricauda sp. NBRC 101325]